MCKRIKPVSQQLVFKTDKRNEQWLFPPSLAELIPLDHPVRFVDQAVDKLDISSILSTYKPGGTSVYHPKMLIKLLIYGYLDNVYSSRKLEKQLHENIVYMWLCGKQKPDHVTISNFRSGKLSSSVRTLFGQVVKLLFDDSVIDLKKQIVDGTKFESVANKYTYVWAKNIARYKGSVEQKIEAILNEIDEHIKRETVLDQQTNKEDQSDDQVQQNQSLNSEQVNNKLKQLDSVKDKQARKKINQIKSKHLPKLKAYEDKEDQLGGRNSYSKTDPDATFMRMKDDRLGTGQLKPAYNIQLSSEEQFIINYTVHQNANDASCYQAHTDMTLTMLDQMGLPRFKLAHGDSIYGTEENYEYLETKEIGNYLKYPSFHRDQKPANKKYPFHRSKLYYNDQEQYYVCPMGQKMYKVSERKRVKKSGYESISSIYQAQNCQNCPLQGMCLKGKSKRRIERNHNLERHKHIAKQNLESEDGLSLRKIRSVDVEPIFGHIKFNRLYDRFYLKGMKKINAELGLHAIAHNLKKWMKINQQWLNKGTISPYYIFRQMTKFIKQYKTKFTNIFRNNPVSIDGANQKIIYTFSTASGYFTTSHKYISKI